MSEPLKDPFAPFEAWTQQEMSDAASGAPRPDRTRRFTFTPATAKVYRTIWKGWIAWLTVQGLRWDQATSAEVRRFLNGPTPGPEGAGRNPIHKGKMANYTQQRYWRVLRGVYALQYRGDPRRDLSDLDAKDRPHVEARSRTSQVLPPRVLLALQDPLELARLLPRESPSHWWVARDRAALAVLAHCALTTSELIDLQASDLRVGKSILQPGFDHQQSIAALEKPPGPRIDVAQGMARSLPLPPPALASVIPWLEERNALLRERHGLAAGSAEAAAHPLFLSRQTEDGKLASMESTSIYQMVRRCLTAALRDPGVKAAVDPEVKLALGAAIVRNSVLQRWLWIEARPAAEVSRLAGLKSVESLRLPIPDSAGETKP